MLSLFVAKKKVFPVAAAPLEQLHVRDAQTRFEVVVHVEISRSPLVTSQAAQQFAQPGSWPLLEEKLKQHYIHVQIVVKYVL